MTVDLLAKTPSPVTKDMEAKPLRCAIYTRISEDTENEGKGVARQEEDCRARAKERGWHVVDVYTENDTSASNLSRKPRPQYDAMMASARSGELDLILAYSNSRLTRRDRELLDIIDLHKETGVQIKTVVSGDDNLSTADGRMVAKIKANVDAAEAERTSERVKRKQAQNRAQACLNTKRAFGWQFKYGTDERGKPVRITDTKNPQEFPALKAGIKALLEGESLASVARSWNKQGLTTTSGKPWNLTRVREVMLRPRNAGLLTWNGEIVGEIQGLKKACTEEKWRLLCSILTSRKAQASAGRQRSTLMSHAATCGKCGRVLIGAKQKGGKKAEGEQWAFTYRCSGSLAHNDQQCFLTIRRDVLEAAVISAVRQCLFFGSVAGLVPTEDESKQVAAMHVDLAQVVADEEQLGTMLGKGELSMNAALPALDGLAERRRTLEASITAITSRYALRSLFASDHEGLMDRAVSIGREFKALDVQQQRDIVRGLLDVVVEPGRHADRIVITRKSDGQRISVRKYDDIPNEEAL